MDFLFLRPPMSAMRPRRYAAVSVRPCWTASCSGVTLSLLVTVTMAPRSSQSQRTTGRRPVQAARCRGVLPRGSMVLGSIDRVAFIQKCLLVYSLKLLKTQINCRYKNKSSHL